MGDDSVVVLGAGLEGLLSAYYVKQRDRSRRVVIIERRDEAALETSYQNGAQLSANYARPWAEPATLRNIYSYLTSKESPLVMGSPKDWLDWNHLNFFAQFLWNCRQDASDANTRELLLSALENRALLDFVRHKERIDFDFEKSGIMSIYRSREELYEGMNDAIFLQENGGLDVRFFMKGDSVAINEFHKQVPHLGVPVSGGVLSMQDAVGDAYKFALGIEETLKEMGVEFFYGSRATSLRAGKGGIECVSLDCGAVVEGSAFIVALGPWSNALLRSVGEEKIMVPAKGYSIDFEVKDASKLPLCSVTDSKYKTVFTPLRSRDGTARMRVAGTAEFVGFKPGINMGRIEMMYALTKSLFPDITPEAGEKYCNVNPWAGFRPLTPSNVPYIEKSQQYPNLFLNFGHGTLGWTLACVSGKRVADLMYRAVDK